MDLYPAERKQQILAHLNKNGRASVSELSQMFGVSEVTIRADLQMLAAQDLIVRTHGGALLVPRVPELSLTLRRQKQVDEKERIGVAAAEFVTNGDAVFLDASSTALVLAHVLRQQHDLTILTHSLVVAQSMLDAPASWTYTPCCYRRVDMTKRDAKRNVPPRLHQVDSEERLR